MSDKILIADLVAAVADSTAFQKSRCDDFVKSFFEAIANALAVDGVAKVKGLGTFKLVLVDERKSVNVQTGAEMVIPAHNKVSFTPDKALKDDINKPFAHLKTYVVKADAPLDPPEQDDDETVADNELSSNNVECAAPGEATTEAQQTSTTGQLAGGDEDATVAVPASAVEGAPTAAPAVAAPMGSNVAAAVAVGQPASSADEAAEVIEEIKNEAGSHSDYFDNWGIEYDNPAHSQADATASADAPAKAASLSSLLAAKAAATDPVIDTVSHVIAAANAGTDASEAATDSDEYDSAGQTVVEDDGAEGDGTGARAAEDNGEGQAEPSVGEDDTDVAPAEPVRSDVPANDGEEDAETCVKNQEVVNSETENEVVAAQTQPDVSVEQKTSVQGHRPVAPVSSAGGSVQHGKVLGVAIIALMVCLGVAYWGINRIDPDFFNGLKASNDNPPVMPTDTTSLAQELSQYDKSADLAEDSLQEQMVIDSLKQQLALSESIQQSLDPLWDGEFVAYMMRQFPQCSLVTKGMRDEYSLQAGETLRMVALEFYGDKAFWIYLYLYNKDRIADPQKVKKHTRIRIPDLDPSLVDAENERCIAVAKQVNAVFAK